MKFPTGLGKRRWNFLKKVSNTKKSCRFNLNSRIFYYFFAIFSASFLGGTLKFGPVVVHGVQGVCILLIFLTAAGVMKSLFVSKKEKLKE